MRNLTESNAISVVKNGGAEIRGKVIISKSGLNGLKACSALDYLVNHCGYIANV